MNQDKYAGQLAMPETTTIWFCLGMSARMRDLELKPDSPEGWDLREKSDDGILLAHVKRAIALLEQGALWQTDKLSEAEFRAYSTDAFEAASYLTRLAALLLDMRVASNVVVEEDNVVEEE